MTIRPHCNSVTLQNYNAPVTAPYPKNGIGNPFYRSHRLAKANKESRPTQRKKIAGKPRPAVKAITHTPTTHYNSSKPFMPQVCSKKR